MQVLLLIPFIPGFDILLPVQSITDLGKHTLKVKDQYGCENVTPATTVNNFGKTCKVFIIVFLGLLILVDTNAINSY